jgi:hypothetical protein
VMDVGPSFATKRQEVVATMLELSKAFPPLFQVAGDLLIKNMDWPGAQEIAERFASLLPAEIRPQSTGQDPKAQLAQLQAALPELEQKLQALNAYAQEMEGKAQELEQENQKLQLAARDKAAELALKDEELREKTQIDREKLALEERKLELDEQRLALEVAQVQATLGDQYAQPER